MRNIETQFDMTLERDNGDINVTVSASGEVDPRDPSVGIFSDGIAYVTIDSVMGENDAVSLTTSETAQAERQAYNELLKALDSE